MDMSSILKSHQWTHWTIYTVPKQITQKSVTDSLNRLMAYQDLRVSSSWYWAWQTIDIGHFYIVEMTVKKFNFKSCMSVICLKLICYSEHHSSLYTVIWVRVRLWKMSYESSLPELTPYTNQVVYGAQLQWPHECHGISDHWQLDCLLNSFFRLTAKNISKLWWDKSTADCWMTLTKGQQCSKSFHVMTSSMRTWPSLRLKMS